MKKLLLASAAAAAFAIPLAQAQTPAPAAPTPEHTVTGNMTIATDYRFRGISQTFGEGFFTVGPAIQGGIDYSHKSGFYLGNWNSNVSGNQYPNGSSIEMDFYGGWKGTFDDFGIDVGTIYYAYPGGTKFPGMSPGSTTNNNFTNVDNWEFYVGGSWKWFSLKYNYSVTDYFGLSEDAIQGFVSCNPNKSCSPLPRNGNTKGSSYLYGAFNYEVMPKLSLAVTAGYTFVTHYNDLSYFDYKVGLTYDFDGWLLGAAIIGTDADKNYWYAVNGTGKVREIGTTGLVLSVGKTF
jgi:uncharacterized protein (TIGR02001 family)